MNEVKNSEASEVQQLINLLRKKVPVTAMLAPSFPIVYGYPHVVSALRKLGFAKVVEVSAGAEQTNQSVVQLLQADAQSRYITSPCPSFVRLVRQKYPDLVPFLAFKADSPMIATTRIVRQQFPQSVPVFIGPCVAKKKEKSEDYPDLDMIVITYKELDEVFKLYNVNPHEFMGKDQFDIAAKSTRIYPVDGGLSITSGADSLLKADQIRIVSGWQHCQQALEEFSTNPQIRLLDVLFCEGGCINGPGIISKLTEEQRKNRVLFYAGVRETVG